MEVDEYCDEVLKSLGIEPVSRVGHVLLPGILAHRRTGLTIDQSAEKYRDYADTAKREMPADCIRQPLIIAGKA